MIGSCLWHTGQSALDLASWCYWVMVEGVQGQTDVCVPRSDCFPEGAWGWDPGPLALHLEVRLEYWCQASLISQAAASEALHGVLIFFCVCVRMAWHATALISGPQTPDTSDSIIFIHLLTLRPKFAKLGPLIRVPWHNVHTDLCVCLGVYAYINKYKREGEWESNNEVWTLFWFEMFDHN